MYCKHCGKEIADDSKFCMYCGREQDSFHPKEPIVDSIEDMESKQSTDNAEIASVPTEEPSNKENPSTPPRFLQKFGFICGIAILAIILLGILDAIRSFSHYLGNKTLFWCAVDLLIGVAFYYIAKYLLNKRKTFRFKDHFESIIFTLVFVVIIAISIIGRLVNNRNADTVQPSNVEKKISPYVELRSMIRQAKTKLPIVIDEFTSWTNVRLCNDGVLFDYLIDDANVDLYEIDLEEYKEEITKKMKTLTDKRFFELCVLTDKSIHYRLTSQWDNHKSVRITYGVYELADMAGMNPEEPYGKESSESRYQRRLNEIKGRGSAFDSKLKQINEQINDLPSEKDGY